MICFVNIDLSIIANERQEEDFVKDAEDWKNSNALAYSLDDKKCCSFELEFVR